MAHQITGTHIRLMSGIPFNSDYKHTRYFTAQSSRDAYFDAFPVVFSTNQANFIRTEGSFKYRVSRNVENLHDVNYIRFYNQRPDGSDSRRIYGFVTHMEYVNREVTDVYFEIDVIQTYLLDCSWRHSFIAREHHNYVRDMSEDPESSFNWEVPTIDEGLYYGTEYHINNVSHVRNNQDMRWLVIISSDPLHGADSEGDINPSYIINPQPLYYYVVPFTPDGESKDVVVGEASEPLETSNPAYVINRLFAHRGTVDHVVSMYVTDDIGIGITTISNDYLNVSDSGGWELESHMLIGDNPEDSSEAGGYAIFVKNVNTFVENTFKVTDNVWNELKVRVGNMRPIPVVTEHKVLSSPYTWIELHDYRGNIVKIRPEYLSGNSLTIVRMGSLGLSNKVSYHVRHYNNYIASSGLRKNFEHEFALIDNNPNDVTIKNEHLAAFLQGNRNQLSNQANQAMIQGLFSGVNAGIGASASTDPSFRAYGIQGGSGLPGIASSISGGAEGLANSALIIAGQQAKKQDLANVPASISKMGGNTAFDVGYGFTGIFVVFKSIKPEYVRTINDYFHAFGYKTNKLKVPNLNTRKRFNYVQTSEAVLHGSIHNRYIERIKQIFNNGITLWHVNNVGDYSGDNHPR